MQSEVTLFPGPARSIRALPFARSRLCRSLFVAVAAGLAGCVHAPTGMVEKYGITEAHATQATTWGLISYLDAFSFLKADTSAKSPRFLPHPLAELDGRVAIKITASQREAESGVDHADALRLARDLKRMTGSLSGYVRKPLPARELVVGLVAASESIERHGRSLAFSGRHRVLFVFWLDSNDWENSTRAIVRTYAHELLHLSLSVHGRRHAAGLREELAANALEHCVEADVFGTTSAPRRSPKLEVDGDTEVERSLTASFGTDRDLDEIFKGREMISSREANSLRTLCRRRIAELAPWLKPDPLGPAADE